MKLSEYARQNSITYQTAWRHFKEGLVKGKQLPTGTIVIEPESRPSKTAIYARVSSHQQKDNLERQVERLSEFCISNGWVVDKVVKEIGSGLNDNRKKLLKLLENGNVGRIVVEDKDRLTRFGFSFMEKLLKVQGRELVVVNKSTTDKEDLLQDFQSIIYSLCARLYGKRRARNKAKKTMECVENASS